jgi:3'(2'), 5'-bisphosphate nucleotidase
MAPYNRERYLAELAVLRVSILTKRIQSTVSEISKDDNTPVTIADYASQALLIKVLHDAFPDDTFLGEEDSAALRADEALRNKVYELVSSAADMVDLYADSVTLPKPESVDEMLDLIDLGGCGNGSRSGRFWVMDPIDGTAAFLEGHQYAVSLALIENGKEVVGILGCPNISIKMTRVSEDNVDNNGLGIMLTAVRGEGSTIRTMTPTGLEGAIPLNVLEPSSSNKLHIIDCAAVNACRHDVIAKLANKFNTIFPNTEILSSHIRYAALIVGGGDVQFWVPASPDFKMYIWDHAGTQLIFTELGGKVTDLDGKDIDFCAGRDLNRNRGLVAARGGIHSTVLMTMNEILSEQEVR